MVKDVAALKAAGNALFAEQEFQAASHKYSEAIALDDQNAILLSNRAACYINLARSVTRDFLVSQT